MRYTYLFIAICFSLLANSQVEKRVVVEHFTNTYCSTCAARNPGLYSNINQQADLLHLSYHPSVPYPQCTLNQHNKAENDGRTQFYGILTGTPRIVIQGDVISASTNYNDASLFTSRQGEMTPYSVRMQLNPTPASTLDLRVVVRMEGGTAIDSAYLFAGIFEDTIFMNSPNGEKDPKNVFRQAFTSIPGNKIGLPQLSGDSVELNYSISVKNEWELDALFAAALLQDADKKILQAATSRDAQSSNPVGLSALDHDELSIFPNPCRELLHINGIPNGTRYQVHNAYGQIVLQGSITGGDLNTSQLPTGMYFLRFAGQAQSTVRFQKRR